MESTATEVASGLETAQTTLKSNHSELSEIQGQVMDLKEKLKKYQDQLYLVATNREYDALTNEIETVKTEVDALEVRQLLLEEQNEALAAQVKEMESQAGTLTTDLDKNRADLSEKTAATEARQKELEAEREALVGNLSQRYLRKYERILKARKQAVVPIQRQACGGCHKQLSHQKQFEIRQMDKLIECENCGRILVHTEEDSPEEA